MDLDNIEIKDLACCGNCITRKIYSNDDSEIIEYCISYDGPRGFQASNYVCNHWKYDGLTQLKRMYSK